MRKQDSSDLDPAKCIVELVRRFHDNPAFPHEIGLFLGYPQEDVYGFIEHKHEGCKCVGCWKVYGDEAYAKKCFDIKDLGKQLKKFVEDCQFKWESGKTQECVYPYIYGKYTELVFILLHASSDSKLEKEFASSTKSRFWRNGKVYETAIENSVQEEIKKYKNIASITKYVREFRFDNSHSHDLV